MKQKEVHANGTDFACLEAGSGEHLILVLHGFPDEASSMRGLLETLASAGYRAVAPFMRGYAPSSLAPDGAYDAVTLGRDALALIEALGAHKASIVGHDWGAVAAYAAAALDPERLDSVVAMAVPPPRVFFEGLLRYPSQLRRSWYMGFFQVPFAPPLVRSGDLALLERLWRAWSPDWLAPSERIEAMKTALRPSGRLEAALSYYRQLRPGRLSFKEWIGSLKIVTRPLKVRALVLAGERDGCIGVELFERLDRAFRAPYRCIRLPHAGHFLHLECPEVVHKEILDFL